jgi:transposase
MELRRETLPDLDQLTVAELRNLLREQHEELLIKDEVLALKEEALALKDGELLSRALEIEKLKLHILKLRRLQYGQRSEMRERQIEQLELLVEDLETTDAQIVTVARARAGRKPRSVDPKPRREFPAHLPRETVTIAPPETCCPTCSGRLSALGEDVSETLELEPLRFKVIRTVRTKLACTNCDTIVQAPAPSRPIERGMAGAGLLAHVLVSKYGDHLPLYRQSEIFTREGVELERTLLAQWVGATSALLAPLAQAIRQHVLDAEVVHGDDTPLPVLAPGRGKTKTGRLWTWVRDERPSGGTVAPAVWFAYTPDRKGEHPQRHLDGFTGILQADAYSGYSKLYESGQVLEAACWAHARRKFVDLEALHKSQLAAEAIERIGALYAIEEEIRGQAPAERQAVRAARSRPLLAALHSWFMQTLPTLSQKSELSKAIRYATSRWEALTRYCDDGRIEIDNNAAERALRCVALGRKNYLFAGSDVGGERAAALYSLIGTAKLNGHNPEAFLRYVLERIADHPIARIAHLLPWNLPANAYQGQITAGTTLALAANG